MLNNIPSQFPIEEDSMPLSTGMGCNRAGNDGLSSSLRLKVYGYLNFADLFHKIARISKKERELLVKSKNMLN